MHTDALLRIRDEDLLRKLNALVIQEHVTTAELLAVMAEVDSRRLYVPAGFSSMFSFCVEQLHLSEDAAYKRIQAARAARRFPVLLDVIADGRVHLAAVVLLAPHLTQDNCMELIEAAIHRRKSEVEESLARRLGGADVRTKIRPIAPAPALPIHASTPTDDVLATSTSSAPHAQLAPGQVGEQSGERVAGAQTPIPAVEPQPLAAPSQRYLLQCPISKETHDLLRYAQALLSHAVPNGEMDHLLQRALKALIPQLEKRKVAVLSERSKAGRSRVESSTTRSMRNEGPPPVRYEERLPLRYKERPTHHGHARTRHIPAQVRRAVWERDKRQCTFVGANGHRCGARAFLEFDHIDPVARGGRATVDNLRLRCRAHNQYEAERAFGAELMATKRNGARRAEEKTLPGPTSSTCPGAS